MRLVSRVRTTAIASVAVLSLVLAGVLLMGEDETKTVSAHFPRTVSLFEGNEVRIMGVPVGRITAIVPEGTSVRVDMEYDAEHSLPADVEAVIVTPTLVADRFVQLTPAYAGGSALPDGGDVPLSRTAVPVELDRVYSGINDLSSALGPNGANADGSLSELLQVSADTLDGQGTRLNQMFGDLARTVDTFDKGSSDLFGTVRGLQGFTSELAAHDLVVRDFVRTLAQVSTQLSGERREVRAMLRELGVALGAVERFVRTNKTLIEKDVADLADVSTVLARRKRVFGTLLEKGPLGLNNLVNAFDANSGAIGSRTQLPPSIDDLDGLLCHWVRTSDAPDAERACRLLTRVLEPLQPLLDPVANPSNGPQPPGPDRSLTGILGGRR